MERWIPLTQYAMEEGVSISTLRRKIKANAVEYRLDDGRYLIRSAITNTQTTRTLSPPVASQPSEIYSRGSDDSAPLSAPRTMSPLEMVERVKLQSHSELAELSPRIDKIERETSENELRWKAMEARVNGLAKKVEFLLEQNSELNMLVKVFEEKLNATL